MPSRVAGCLRFPQPSSSPALMRLALPVLACAFFAIAAHSTSARTVRARRDVLSSSAFDTASNSPFELTTDTLDETSRTDGRRRPYSQSTEGRDSDFELRGMDMQRFDADQSRSSELSDSPDSDESGEKDFTSPPTPISEGRRRAGMLGILGAIILTATLAYNLYMRRERMRELLSSLQQHLPALSVSSINLKHISIPTLSLSTLSAPQRTRRRRLRRSKAGFRPHVSRLRAWAAETGDGLLNDYDYDYDGDYERGPAHNFSSPASSSSSNSYAQEAEAFDLGADEDFMIGAPRRGAVPTPAPSKLGKSTGKVWGRWKGSSGSGKEGKKGRGGGSGSGTVLFSVAEADDLELETDEALPLAPTPHHFVPGLGGMKGYGSAG